MLVDTHCHLHFDAFDADREEVIERARAAGVMHLVNVGTDLATNQAAFALAGRHSFMSSTAGLHPHHAHQISDPEFESLQKFVREHVISIIDKSTNPFENQILNNFITEINDSSSSIRLQLDKLLSSSDIPLNSLGYFISKTDNRIHPYFKTHIKNIYNSFKISQLTELWDKNFLQFPIVSCFF